MNFSEHTHTHTHIPMRYGSDAKRVVAFTRCLPENFKRELDVWPLYFAITLYFCLAVLIAKNMLRPPVLSFPPSAAFFFSSSLSFFVSLSLCEGDSNLRLY